MFDSHYTIGKSHKVCEDYALHTDSMAALADGCSSTVDSDVGARLLCHSSINHPLDDAVLLAEVARKTIDLSPYALCSTIIKMYQEKDVVKVEYYGDCTVAASIGNSFEIQSVSFPREMPYYPYYKLQNEYDNYINVAGNEYTINDHPLSIVNRSQFIECNVISWESDDLDFVFVFSDGIRSFTRGSETMPEREFLNRFFPIKNRTGEFATRRLNRVLAELKKEGWEHQDDISVIGWKYV